MRREYVVTIPDAEAARLRAFSNKAAGKKHWPLGPNRRFWRKNETTFVVKEYVGSALGGALVMTLGKATLPEGSNQVAVTVETKAHGMGYLLIACGVVAGCLTPRDGISAFLMGTALVLAGWFLFAKRPGLADDLDEVEEVLRAEIRGHWQLAGANAEAAYVGPPRTDFETANRLTNFLHGDDLDSVAALPARWSLTDLLPARTVLSDRSLDVRRRGSLGASIHADAVSFFVQIPWAPDLVNEFPAMETWVVDHDGRPLAVVGWDAKLERQVRDAGLRVRRFAHSVNMDVIPYVWAGRPTYPVAVHVDSSAHR
ncbi:hypothetical protein [Nocardioides sp. W7]|uniref:hypothetical protein n=1 Tax=Nocardioides sp. W7 TaxID=2931390 RepID=UPI001FD036FC|nr:hypothetical protein [Nocardioides sp. W7]